MVPEGKENPSSLFPQITALTNKVTPTDKHIQELIWVEGTQWIPESVIVVNRLLYHHDQVYVPDIPAIKHHILCLYHDSPITGHLRQTRTFKLV